MLLNFCVLTYLVGNTEQQHYEEAKLALLLQLSQTRDGAKYMLHANLFRTIEQSGLFTADPELQAGKFSSVHLTYMNYENLTNLVLCSFRCH
jgi:hypothetical protein